MKARLIPCALLLLLVIGSTSSHADSDSSAQVNGRFGFVTAGRTNLGPLAEQYRFGLLFGVHAGIELALGESPWSVGLGWTTLVRGFYFASDSSLVDQSIVITEADFGLRLRRRITIAPRFVSATAGGIYSTSSVPIPPGDKRRYLGYYGGLGYEYEVLGSWLLGAEARYARFSSGPENLSVFLSFVSGI